MDKQKIKQAIDRQISDKPLLTEEDRQRFYKRKQKTRLQNNRVSVFPKIVTVILAFALIGGPMYLFSSDGNILNHAPSNERETIYLNELRNDQDDSGPVSYHSKVKPMADSIIEEFRYDLHLQEAQDLYGKYGEGLTYEKTIPSTGKRFLKSEFVYFKADDFPHTKNMSFSEEDFKQGNLGLLFEITWENENEVRSAMLTHLSADGKRIITKTYNADGYFEVNGQKKEQVKYPLAMQGLVLESIGQSINKDPERLSEDDLSKVKTLMIDASHLNGIYDIEDDPGLFEKMNQLTDLTLIQARIPDHQLKLIPNLERVTFIGPTVNDLSSVASGLQSITYLNIKESSFRGGAEDILKLENLETVVLDKSVVTDWETLKQNGVHVLEETPS